MQLKGKLAMYIGYGLFFGGEAIVAASIAIALVEYTRGVFEFLTTTFLVYFAIATAMMAAGTVIKVMCIVSNHKSRIEHLESRAVENDYK